MKKTFTKITAFLLITCAAHNLNAQNLVPNPGFEIQDTCPLVSQLFLAPPWVSANSGTPDLFNSTCSTQNSPGRTGIGSGGVYAYSVFANNREYMEVPLTSPLQAGQTYVVNFYVRKANFRYACNSMGAHFSSTLINQASTSNLTLTPQISNPANNMLTGTGWSEISGSFVAAGGEQYMTIGNFNNDANTDTLVVNSASTSKVAYYYVDDIYVGTGAAGINNATNADHLVNVFPNPVLDKINIQSNTSLKLNTITISNNLGQVIESIKNPEIMGGLFTIPTGDLPSGVYFITINTELNNINKKVIIK